MSSSKISNNNNNNNNIISTPISSAATPAAVPVPVAVTPKKVKAVVAAPVAAPAATIAPVATTATTTKPKKVKEVTASTAIPAATTTTVPVAVATKKKSTPVVVATVAPVAPVVVATAVDGAVAAAQTPKKKKVSATKSIPTTVTTTAGFGGFGSATTTAEPKKRKSPAKPKIVPTADEAAATARIVQKALVRSAKFAKPNTNLLRSTYKNVARIKRPQSAWMFFSTAERGRQATLNPNTKVKFGDTGKFASRIWHTMTPAQKKPYYDAAQQDKTRYAAEKAKRTDIEQKLDEYLKKRRREKHRQELKKNREAGMPDKVLTAYMRFVKKNRPQFVTPDVKFADVGVLMGKAWHALSDAQKSPYIKEFVTERQAYDRNMKIYAATKKAASIASALAKPTNVPLVAAVGAV